MRLGTLRAKHAALAPVFTERSRRLWAATEALEPPRLDREGARALRVVIVKAWCKVQARRQIQPLSTMIHDDEPDRHDGALPEALGRYPIGAAIPALESRRLRDRRTDPAGFQLAGPWSGRALRIQPDVSARRDSATDHGAQLDRLG